MSLKGSKMEPEKYTPLIGCAECKKPTRHHYLTTKLMTFKCEVERRVPVMKEKYWQDKAITFLALVHRCSACGATRFYGNIDDPENRQRREVAA